MMAPARLRMMVLVHVFMSYLTMEALFWFDTVSDSSKELYDKLVHPARPLNTGVVHTPAGVRIQMPYGRGEGELTRVPHMKMYPAKVPDAMYRGWPTSWMSESMETMVLVVAVGGLKVHMARCTLPDAVVSPMRTLPSKLREPL